MNRREFHKVCAIGAASALAGPQALAKPDENPKKPFKLRGVYFHDGFTVDPEHHAPLHWGREEWLRQIRWLHACGVNAVEFATMLEFNRIPQTAMEREKIEDRKLVLELAHSLGLEFGYILTNTVLSTVPDGEEPGHQLLNRAVQLCPKEPGNFEKTIALQEWYMDTYKEANFFDEFAADWGACHCGKCAVPDYMHYVDTLAKKLAEKNPAARMYANTWCIAYWGPGPEAQGWEKVFDNEIRGSREVIELLDAMPKNVNLALPCHHLYRPLVYTTKGGKKNTPVFPTRDDIKKVEAMGRGVLAWPHFVMDDDTGRAPQWGLVHSEVRYIRDLLQRLQETGIDQVMGNLYLPYLQLSNTYAYGRLLDAPDTDPATILKDFAKLVAHKDNAESLAEVMAWMENHSYWEEQMPEDGRLPELPCTLDKAGAVKALAAVRPNPSPEMPLPYPPADWLKDLARSIDKMAWVVA